MDTPASPNPSPSAPAPDSLGDRVRGVCRELASGVTALHPLIGRVEDAAAKGEMLKALFEITRQVEVIKKQMQRTERRDDSRLL